MHEPKVTVLNSEHLLVNWAESFNHCDSTGVKSAIVEITCSNINEHVNFSDKEARIKANPCQTHLDIKVKLLIDGKGETEVWSESAQYNDYIVSPKLEELYSGLLRKPIHDKICDINATTFPMSDVPDAIKKCVKKSSTIKKEWGRRVFKCCNQKPEKRTEHKSGKICVQDK